jgi:hypothetical protein
MSALETIGMPQSDSKYLAVVEQKWDTILFKGSDGAGTKQTLSRQRLFSASQKKRDELQTAKFPTETFQQYTINGFAISHNLVFDNPNDLEIFEQSYLKITLLDTHLYNIPIKQLLNYNRISMPFTELTDTERISKSQYLSRSAQGTIRKIEPIIIPEKADIEIEFVPGGAGLTTALINEKTGFKWGVGIYDQENSPTMFIRIDILGTLLRQRTN